MQAWLHIVHSFHTVSMETCNVPSSHVQDCFYKHALVESPTEAQNGAENIGLSSIIKEALNT